jgi:hypothetical protein
VLAGWIAETLVDSRAHRFAHFVRQMCGGIVVKIDFVNHKDLGVVGRSVRILQCREQLKAPDPANQPLKPHLELKTGTAVG